MKISPSQLVKLADDECQILKHSMQWVETIDPSVVAMQALFHNTNQGNNDLFKTLAANLSTLTKMHQISSYDKHQGGDGSSSGRRFHYDTPDWVYDAPTDLSQQKLYQGKTWHFCTKCGRDGKSVCPHSVATHRPREEYLRDRCARMRSYDVVKDRGARSHDDTRSRSRTPPGSRDSSYMHDRSRSVRFQMTPLVSPNAKFSLLESINAFADVTE